MWREVLLGSGFPFSMALGTWMDGWVYWSRGFTRSKGWVWIGELLRSWVLHLAMEFLEFLVVEGPTTRRYDGLRWGAKRVYFLLFSLPLVYRWQW